MSEEKKTYGRTPEAKFAEVEDSLAEAKKKFLAKGITEEAYYKFARKAEKDIKQLRSEIKWLQAQEAPKP